VIKSLVENSMVMCQWFPYGKVSYGVAAMCLGWLSCYICSCSSCTTSIHRCWRVIFI